MIWKWFFAAALTGFAGACVPSNAHAEEPRLITAVETREQFDPRSVDLTPGSVLARAREAMSQRRWRDARTSLEAAPPSGPEAWEEQYLLARVALTQGDWSTTHRIAERLGASSHALALWARLLDAESLVQYRPAESRAVVDALRADAHVPRAVAVRAERLRGRFADAEGQGESPRPVAPPSRDFFAEADAFSNQARYDEALRALDRVVTLGETTGQYSPEERCTAQLTQGRILYRARERRRAVDKLNQLLANERCSDTHTRAWGLFVKGRSLTQLSENEGALEAFDELANEAPEHNLADDALVRGARIALELGDLEGARQRLEKTLREHPRGDMRAEAFFELAWTHHERGEHAAALDVFDRAMAFGVVETTEDSVGRIAYWRARTLRDLGRREDAACAFESVVLRFPHTYYAQIALARLADLDTVRAALAETGLRTLLVSASETFDALPSMRSEEFERAIGLLRLGEHEAARAELETLGAFGEGDGAALLPIVAALWDRAGLRTEALGFARTALVASVRALSRSSLHALLRIAFPRVYSDEIQEAATEASIPVALLRAVAREESSFDPRAVSPVRARGLVQLMEPTAQRFGRDLGLRVTAETLHDPRTNLRIGAAFLSFLWNRYPGRANALPAAYNAGEGAADRWLRQAGEADFDEWVERIPYEESRRYTRRVLQSWGVYSALDGAPLPTIAWASPSAASTSVAENR
jgi:soluble lytic murein transglycosylase